jgi:sugar lactone lactonase YvrE
MVQRVRGAALAVVSVLWAYACSSDHEAPVLTLPSGDGGDILPPEADAGDAGDADTDGGDAAPMTPFQGATPIQIADAAQYTTSPKWRPAEKVLYVALPEDMGGAGSLVRMDANGNGSEIVRTGDGVLYGTMGNAIDKGGALVSAERKRIVRTTNHADGGFVDVATGWGADGGVPFDSPRNLVVRRSDDTIFFTDPGFYATTPDKNRIFRVQPDGGAFVLGEFAPSPGYARPNGIALSKDEKTLFVSFTESVGGPKPHVERYTVGADGSLSGGARFAELEADDLAEGIAIDDDGDLYVAFTTGINVYKSDGTLYGKRPSIAIGDKGAITGVAFGGADRKTLFATTETGKILSMQVRVPGVVE